MKRAIRDSLFEALTKTKRTNTGWSTLKKPVAVVDGSPHSLADIVAPLEGCGAYVVGLNEKTARWPAERLRVSALSLYEMRVEDLSSIATMTRLRHLGIDWNTKARSLAPLTSLTRLETLSLNQTPKLQDLSPLMRLPNLRAVRFAGGIWSKNRVQCLQPLASLPKLTELLLGNLAIDEGGLRPLAECSSLRRLEVSNQFDTADYAYLSVHLPDTECDYFRAWVEVAKTGDLPEIMIIGRRKPFLRASEDAERIRKYERAFAKLQQRFRQEAAG